MIHYIKYHEVDKQKWDNCIDQSVNNLIYAYSWYLDIVCPGWEALIEDDYVSVMPLTARKKYGINYLYPPYFAQQLGVFSKKKLTQIKVEEFLNSIPSHYKFIELYVNIQNTFEFPGFIVKKNINIELLLDAPYELLRKKFSRNTERNIRKAEKNDLTLQKNISPSELINIFRKNKGEQINNLTNKNYTVLLRLINTCSQKGYVESWGAFSGGKLCAGVVTLIKNNRMIFLFSATNKRAKESYAMFLLIDKFIRNYAGKGMLFDFEGSNLPGVARLYKSFGSKEYVYLQLRKNNLPTLIRWVKG